MKLYSLLLVFACMFSACNGQHSEAKKLQEKLQTTMKEHVPGTQATTKNGWTMSAKINGKEWSADAIMPPEPAGRIIGYYDKDYISFPYDVRDMVPGKKLKISDDWAVDYVTNNDGICGGTKGEVNITKVDADWAEGTFFFTVTHCLGDPNKNIEVTDGFFRISLKHTP